MRCLAGLLAAIALNGAVHAGGFYDHLYEPGTLRLDEVIGMEVLTPDGRSVGTIRDVLFERTTGAVQSIALDRDGGTYPIRALVSADAPRKVIAEPTFDSSGAGGTALLPSATPGLSSALGQEVLIDLRDGRVLPAR
jgi:sporulation protein YlmC with PRC-barrel domain